MICFRDRTFCRFYEDCEVAVQGMCDRPLTTEVELDAIEWWGGDDAPIAEFSEKPQCHKPIQEAP